MSGKLSKKGSSYSTKAYYGTIKPPGTSSSPKNLIKKRTWRRTRIVTRKHEPPIEKVVTVDETNKETESESDDSRDNDYDSIFRSFSYDDKSESKSVLMILI